MEPASGGGRLTCLGWPEEHGGRGLSVAHRVAFYEEYARADAPRQGQPHRRGAARADADRLRHPGAAEALPAEDPRRHRAVVPGLLRARRRHRPGQRVDHGRARRRRVGDQRPEGVDVAGAPVALVLRGGPHREGLQAARRPVVPAGAAGPARRRDPPDRAADRDARSSTRCSSTTPAPTPTSSSASPATAGGSRWERSPSSAACRRWASRSVTHVSFPTWWRWPKRPAPPTTR